MRGKNLKFESGPFYKGFNKKKLECMRTTEDKMQ